jgi:glutamate dehydrogenase (NADP+)
VGSGEDAMAWMADEYSALSRRFTPAAFTGKPVALHGSHGRREATGYGGLEVLEAVLAEHPEVARRVAVEGFGNVGSHFAEAAVRRGYTLVGVSDALDAVADDQGLDPARVLEAKAAGGRVATAGRRALSQADLLALDCDVLVLAAIEHSITTRNADSIRAKVVLELGNNSISAAANASLERRGIIVIPDILANAGGVIASYFEWTQNLQGYYWTSDVVLARVGDKLRAATEATLVAGRDHDVSLRTAAQMLALERLMAATPAAVPSLALAPAQ